MAPLPSELRVPGYTLPAAPEQPAPPRDAATVALITDGRSGLEVFVLRRDAGMSFAGGMTVFPGGGVDRRDGDRAIAWSGPQPAWWARRLDCDETQARALVCAAVRETFEECGVLLAGSGQRGDVVTDAGRYHDARAALAGREISLAQLFTDNGLVLRSDLLMPWSRWITPVAETRRFDARFFVAALPDGQRPDGATSEATAAGWSRPRTLLDRHAQHRVGLMPPTQVTLAELDEHPDAATALRASRAIEPVMPRLVQERDGVRVLLPGSPDYDDGRT